MAVASRPRIPDRLSFRISDVSELAGVEPYVLRFWETAFPMLQPKKSKSGHREYRRKDVELILEIKRLLYDQKFTIPGARKTLQERLRGAKKVAAPKSNQRPRLEKVRKELEAILALLKKGA
jgi:DNA-binding transcriptional MerR regulator